MTRTDTAAVTESPDTYGAYPRLSADQIEALATRGDRRDVAPGEVLIREGEPSDRFVVILRGSVQVITGSGRDEPRRLLVHGAGRFLGELGLLAGQAAFYTAVAGADTGILAVPVERLTELLQHDAQLGDLIVRAFFIRREILIGLDAGFRIIGSHFSADTRRLREFAARNRLPHRYVDLEEDTEAEEALRALGLTLEDTPVVIWRDGKVLRNPSNARLAQAIGLTTPRPDGAVRDLLVIGAGPAGLAAAVYGAADGLSTTAFDATATGGQAATSSRIENYLGFPAGISGAELAERAAVQARRFGAEINLPAEAVSLVPDGELQAASLELDGQRVEIVSRTVVVATGARYRELDVPGLGEFAAASVCYAATFMEARQCVHRPVAVVGGGNSAGQAAVFLAEVAPRVHLLAREHDLQQKMSKYLVDRIGRHPRIIVHTNTHIRRAEGDGCLQALVLEDLRSGELESIPVDMLFVFIGARPRTDWLGGTVALNADGFVLTGADAASAARGDHARRLDRPPHRLETSRPGVFAAGDVRHGATRRVGSAVGDGAAAIQMLHDHLQRTGSAAR
ncbi:FAD-dependent oxidoreductase [Pseudofrankia asymbiotica]|uniref:Cyclic nucleotide-binding protein n=1 Tax=Pseudofrankia asymbiotica TaxID=1834516 RepID=A0A1V2I7L0_9ACTN|nr:FAD-dependent oxidoreductase [Pseudofrankia asymbiotica]ONH27793.1 cyclic nucleotide-binding protein [Pseudofrankia asymbiotica]